jgi:hypothetical protein
MFGLKQGHNFFLSRSTDECFFSFSLLEFQPGMIRRCSLFPFPTLERCRQLLNRRIDSVSVADKLHAKQFQLRPKFVCLCGWTLVMH